LEDVGGNIVGMENVRCADHLGAYAGALTF
jgi:hypothetical protein